MNTNLDLSLIADLPQQNMVLVLLTELINFQNGLIGRLQELDVFYSAQLSTKINNALDRMHEYSRRLQILNRNILELTKRVRLIMLRLQAPINGKTKAEDLSEIC